MLTHVLPTIAGGLPETVVFGDPAGAPQGIWHTPLSPPVIASNYFMDGLLPAIESSDGQRSRARKRAERAEHTLDRLQVEIGQVRRKCPCGKHGCKCRLDAEPMIVSIIAGDLPETVVFGDPTGAPAAARAPAEARAPEAASCASSTVPRVFNRRPKLYITDYSNKPTE